MAKKQVRDSAYYEERLKNEFPAIYADLQAGKHRTITEAAIAAWVARRPGLFDHTNVGSRHRCLSDHDRPEIAARRKETDRGDHNKARSEDRRRFGRNGVPEAQPIIRLSSPQGKQTSARRDRCIGEMADRKPRAVAACRLIYSMSQQLAERRCLRHLFSRISARSRSSNDEAQVAQSIARASRNANRHAGAPMSNKLSGFAV